MQTVASAIGSSFGVFWVVSFLDQALFAVLCILATAVMFRLSVRFRWWKALTAAALCAAVGGLAAAQRFGALGGATAISALQVVCPFVCTMIFFPRRDFWKSCVVVFGGNVADVLKYFALILFFDYAYGTSDPALELLLDTLICFVLAAVMAGVFLLGARRRSALRAPVGMNLPLYLLIVVTLVVFMTTVLMLGVNHSGARPVELAFTLANVPLFTGTAIYGAVVLLRARVSEENYRQMLSMQMRHYAQMEKKNEELRIFRHDFPKQIRPIAACLHEGRVADAEELLRHFDSEIAYTRPRFVTGNTMLDTVLECAQQTAEKDGVRIVWRKGGLFPAEGIAPEDICTIFPNALDNAVEACRKVEGEREVSVVSRMTPDAVYVRISNPVADKVQFRAGQPQTTKSDRSRHGFGTQSMKKAAAKYGSNNLRFTCADGQFSVDMELCLLNDRTDAAED